MDNKEIAGVLDDIGNLLEIDDESPFRIRAYRNAADTIRFFDPPLSEMVARGDDLTELEGIGKAIAEKIVEIVKTGKLAFLQRLTEKSSPGLLDLLRIPGVGPKKVRVLREHLGILSIEDLRAAIDSGRISEVPGFGAKSLETLKRRLEKLDS